MKNQLRFLFQKILGYQTYLFIFALYNIRRMKWGWGREKEFIHFMEMIPAGPGVLLDIGANIGVMSASMAGKRPDTKVFAFEPIPDNQATIERVIQYLDLKNIQLFKTALGEENGEIEMVVPLLHKAQMQGLSHVVGANEYNGTGQLFSVPMQRLDTIREVSESERILAIKIDVENFEYYVLKGAHTVLIKHRPVIYCELWHNEKRELCIDYVKSIGYTVKIFHEGGLIDFNGEGGINFFFVPV